MKRRYLVILTVIVFSVVLRAQNSIGISFSLPAYTLDRSEISEFISGISGNFVSLEMDDEDFGVVSDLGYPKIPQKSYIIRLPSSATNVRVSVNNINKTSGILASNTYIEPFLDYGPDGVDGKIDVSYYLSANKSYIDDFYSLSEVFEIMGEQAVCLTVIPFNYIPRRRSLDVLHKADFQILWDETNSTKATVSSSQVRESFFSEIFTNYIPRKASRQNSLLIIAASRYMENVSTFAQYKQNLGFFVETVSTGDIGNTVSDIRNCIKNTNADFVLLVGNVIDIPYTSGNPSGSEEDAPMTDQNYRRIGSDDRSYGDVFLGRWSVSSERDLSNIINKTIKAETELRTLPQRAAFLAGNESRTSMQNSFKKGHEKAIQKGFSKQNYESERYYQSSQETIENLRNTYPSWFIYSGHGSLSSMGYGGAYPSITSSYFLRDDVFPFVFVFACKTGAYGDMYNICNSLLLNPKGCVVYFGSSVSTYCNSDVAIESEILGDSFGEKYIGSMVTKGMTLYRKRFWSRLNLTRTRRYMKSYNLLGDPSLLVRGIPEMVENYSFTQCLKGNNGLNVLFESAKNIDIQKGLSIRNQSFIAFRASEGITLQGSVSTDETSSVNLKAKQVHTSNLEVQPNSIITIEAKEKVVLDAGTYIGAGANVEIKISEQ